ncbi:hypothetical protein B0H14DRAFT_2362495, partial [Mycena olivaceomarginata]
VVEELLGKLDMYTAKLALVGSAANDSGYASTSSGRSMSVSSVGGASVASAGNGVMGLVSVVVALFKMSNSEAQREVDALRGICTEKAALTDLKTCLKNLSAGAPFPGRREDFDTDEAWQHWRTTKTTHLQQLMAGAAPENRGAGYAATADRRVVPHRLRGRQR